MNRSRPHSQPNSTAPRSTPRLKRLAIYAFYDGEGQVSEYVAYKLERLKEHVERLVVVVNGKLQPEGQQTLERYADKLVRRENQGFDIWAFRAGLIEGVGWEALAEFDELLLLNATFFGPLYPFSELFDEMDGRAHDFWGITAFKGPVPNGFTFVGMIPFHIQSYFMAFRKRVFTDKAFRDYWEALPPMGTYLDAVLKHEVMFTEFLNNLGFRHSVYCDPEKYKAVNPGFDLIDLLVENRCPTLKRRAFFHEPLYLDLNNVELSRAMELVRKTDYPTSLIWKDITRVTRPADLSANATLHEVVPHEGQLAPLRPGLKVAVVAHVRDPKTLGELVQQIDNIPVAYDLFVSTGDAAAKTEIEVLLKVRSQSGKTVVTAVGSKPGPMGALFKAHRELLRTGGYDYVCRVHTEPSPLGGFARRRHYKEHHYENLLHTRDYVANLLGIFERDSSVGVLVPSEIHIANDYGAPTLGPDANRWAKKLGITVPLDGFDPATAVGSMFWARPSALKVLLSQELTDVETADAAAQDTLERLLVPSVQQSGFYAMAVQTPGSMARNYVKLEYKLQRIIGELPHSSRVVFPKVEISDFLRLRSPPVFFVVQKSFRATRAVYRGAKKVANRVGREVQKLI